MIASGEVPISHSLHFLAVLLAIANLCLHDFKLVYQPVPN